MTTRVHGMEPGTVSGRRVSGDGVRVGTTLVLMLILAGGASSPVDAQVRPSERATVSQTVDGTVIALDYARPRARGRAPLFGALVPWDEVWTPGANDATVLETSREIEIEGHQVPAGRWSVWMVVREEGPWEMVLDPRDDLWHTQRPSRSDDQIRFPVAPEEAAHAEALVWSFPDVRRDGATLVMRWGDVRVPMRVRVEPTYTYTLTPDEARPFVGEWEMTRARGGDEGARRAFEIVHHSDGSLRAEGSGDHEFEWVLQRKARGTFALGYTRNGELWSGSSTFLEMTYEGGEPTGFAIRDGADRVVWRGERVRPGGADPEQEDL